MTDGLQDVASTLQVVEVNAMTDPRWEAFLDQHPNPTIFHHPLWLEALQREYQRKSLYLACVNGKGAIRGILPLIETRGLPIGWGPLIIGHRLSSLPRTPTAGLLALDQCAAAALVRAAIESVSRSPGMQLQLKMPTNELHGIVDGMVSLCWKEIYVLDLPANPEQLHFGNSRNHARIKWAVGKAAKNGVVVRPAETEADLRAWYELYLETMRCHAVPPRSYRFFEALWELLRPRGFLRVLLAEQTERKRDRLLAGSMFLTFRRTFFYYLNGRRRVDLKLRPNDVIQWHAIHDAVREGFSHYDLGEVEENQQGLIEFKEKWGAKPQRTHRYYFPPPHDLQPSSASGGLLHRLTEAAWRKLPLPVTAVAGNMVYSYM